MRVKVMSGDGTKLVGYGNYSEDVTTYVAVMPDGSLRSNSNAEVPLDVSQVPGAVLRKIDHNPKIVLDDGRVVYGCQVWWEEVTETVEVERSGYDPWAGDYANN